MNRIVISGYYGFGNAGDEAMLSAILEAILEVIPDARITVISGNPRDTAAKHGVTSIGRFSLLSIIRSLWSCDLLISGGGSLLQDVTSHRSLYYYLSIIFLATVLHKKIMIYAQGIGPLTRQLAKRAVANVLNHVTMITVRDQISKDELLELGVHKPPIKVTADAVLSMHAVDTTIGKRLLKAYNLSGVKYRIGVSVRSWKQATSYRHSLAKALTTLQEEMNAEVLFIPMSHPEDTLEARKISELMKHKPILLDRTYTTTELLALSGCVDVMIGVRLHALVFASLMKKPVVGISYDPKIINFLDMIGQAPIGTLDSLDETLLVERVKQLLLDKSVYEQSFKQIETLQEESLKTAHIALSLLD